VNEEHYHDGNQAPGSGDDMMAVSRDQIRDAVRTLGLAQHPLCVHASLRSFGWVTGGPAAILDGLLAEGCTVLIPTFSWIYAIPPPPDIRPAQNGWHYDRFAGPTTGIGHVYTPSSRELDTDMGVLAAAVLAMPQHIRGRHPLCSFTAIGPQAHMLISQQGPVHVYAPLEQLAEVGGSIVLMGVGLEAMTLLHLAEQRAGRHLFWRWANDAAGQPQAVAVGGCSDGFRNLAPSLASLKCATLVGMSQWQVFPAQQTLEVATQEIHRQPAITHCGDEACERCNDAVQGGPPELADSQP
jgi:aminoglycoside 3-N-acetyltransferase